MDGQCFGSCLDLSDQSEGPLLPRYDARYSSVYEELAPRWWQWAYSIASGENPLQDVTGQKAHVGQNENIWFLGGTFGTGRVMRKVTFTAGKGFFFLVLGIELSEAEAPGTEEKERIFIVTDTANRVFEKKVIVDGIYIEGLDRQRVASTPFEINLPEKNVLRNIYGSNIARQKTMAVADGYYALLAPLKPGKHVIKFGGYFIDRSGYSYSTEAYYEIDVVEPGK
jgi:hypothetical protein